MQTGSTIIRVESGREEISFSAKVRIVSSVYKAVSICISVHEACCNILT